MIDQIARVIAEAVPVEPEHVTWLGWIIDHLREEIPLFGGGFVAYVLHNLYHRLWHRPAHFLLRLILRRPKA